MSVEVDADIDENEDLFGKVVSDLQENIVVGTSGITGTLKYVDDYSSAYSGDQASGNYLVLHYSVPDVEGVTITVEVVNGTNGPSTLDPDGICISRIADKSTQTIRVVASKEGYTSVTKEFSLTGLTLNNE